MFIVSYTLNILCYADRYGYLITWQTLVFPLSRCSYYVSSSNTCSSNEVSYKKRTHLNVTNKCIDIHADARDRTDIALIHTSFVEDEEYSREFLTCPSKRCSCVIDDFRQEQMQSLSSLIVSSTIQHQSTRVFTRRKLNI